MQINLCLMHIMVESQSSLVLIYTIASGISSFTRPNGAFISPFTQSTQSFTNIYVWFTDGCSYVTENIGSMSSSTPLTVIHFESSLTVEYALLYACMRKLLYKLPREHYSGL